MRQAEFVAESNAIAEQSYSQLKGEWAEWLAVAKRYEHKVPGIDRYDIRHAILIELAKARQRDNKPLPLLRAYRIASLTVALYWRQAMRRRTVSLDARLDDGDGDATELMDTIADDQAIDLDAWLDAKTWLLGCPIQLIRIAHKRQEGQRLTATDSQYLWRYHKRQQKAFI